MVYRTKSQKEKEFKFYFSGSLRSEMAKIDGRKIFVGSGLSSNEGIRTPKMKCSPGKTVKVQQRQVGDVSTQTLQFKALYDYNAQRDDEMSVSVGDIVEFLGKQDNGWVYVKILQTVSISNKGKCGWVPKNYLELTRTQLAKAPPPPKARKSTYGDVNTSLSIENKRRSQFGGPAAFMSAVIPHDYEVNKKIFVPPPKNQVNKRMSMVDENRPPMALHNNVPHFGLNSAKPSSSNGTQNKCHEQLERTIAKNAYIPKPITPTYQNGDRMLTPENATVQPKSFSRAIFPPASPPPVPDCQPHLGKEIKLENSFSRNNQFISKPSSLPPQMMEKRLTSSNSSTNNLPPPLPPKPLLIYSVKR